MSLLEKVMVIFESKERNGVSHHPNVPTATIKIRLAPFPIIIRHV